jgi:two-component system CheB/CheR fusion protein
LIGTRIATLFAMAHVLLVEDSEDILFIMQLELTAMGYTVDTADNASDALALAERNPPDVIVSDLYMPDIDGFEFIRRVRQMDGFANVPAIALTGFSLQRDINGALAAGFTTHLVKPVEAVELIKQIERLTNVRLQQRAG